MKCDKCFHADVCGSEWVFEEALTYCDDFLGWIPVSERLPKIHNYSEKYLVTLECGGVYTAMFYECDGKHWWAYDDVIAWMPLPKPYKAESEE